MYNKKDTFQALYFNNIIIYVCNKRFYLYKFGWTIITKCRISEKKSIYL